MMMNTNHLAYAHDTDDGNSNKKNSNIAVGAGPLFWAARSWPFGPAPVGPGPKACPAPGRKFAIEGLWPKVCDF